MLPSIPVAEFVAPQKGSRAWNAVNRAIDLAPTTNIELIGELRGERYYRVRAKGRDRHCVIRWYSELSRQEVAKCDCEAHYVPHSPQPCFHIAAVLIYEATHPPRKLASMGRKESPSNGTEATLRRRRSAPREKVAIPANGGSPPAGEIEGRDRGAP